MTQLVNPKIEVRVFGQTEIVIKDLYMDFEIVKDLEEEPNEATVRVYNRDEDNRRKLTNLADQNAPIEIWATPSGQEELVMAYRGEIDTVTSTPTRPGYETTITCLSGQDNHRARFVDTKTFAQGTAISDIMEFFIDQIGLPRGKVDELPDTGVLLSQSFSGPAYRLLQRYAFDVGMYAYILDGKLHVTSIYEPPDLTVTTIPREILLTAPEATTRQDEQFVEMQTIVESTSIDPFRKKRRRRKRRKKTKVLGENDYVQYEAVDKTIPGMNFQLLLQPQIQPVGY